MMNSSAWQDSLERLKKGNTIGPNELGSIEYAVGHLGCPLVVVLGHTHCGAVDAAMHGEAEGHVATIIKEIQSSIKSETDAKRTSSINAEHSASVISENISGVKVVPALYDIETGRVEWLS